MTITIEKSKTSAAPVDRTLKCSCTERSEKTKAAPVCPVHAISRLLAAMPNGQSAKISGRITDKKIGTFLLNVLAKLNIEYKAADGTHLSGTHSIRGGGALMVSVMGVPLEIIKKFGRWNSDAVHIYVLDAPLLTMAKNLARTLMGVPAAFSGLGEDNCIQLKTPPVIGEIIRVWHQFPVLTEGNPPEISGMWMEGACQKSNKLSFVLKFEDQLSIGNSDEWSSTIKFPLIDGPAWYKLTARPPNN